MQPQLNNSPQDGPREKIKDLQGDASVEPQELVQTQRQQDRRVTSTILHPQL